MVTTTVIFGGLADFAVALEHLYHVWNVQIWLSWIKMQQSLVAVVTTIQFIGYSD